MKYRHGFHAGNFADVHKHVTLLALIAALQRKDKGFLYLETHAGRGSYALDGADAAQGGEARLGIGRLRQHPRGCAEIDSYLDAVALARAGPGTSSPASGNSMRIYPGSPLLAARALRPQDRGRCCEIQSAECRALERALKPYPRVGTECGDGYAALKSLLPPPERRALVFIDPPYEEQEVELERAMAGAGTALARLPNAVVLLWYPIKDQRELDPRLRRLAEGLGVPALTAELWVHPRDSRVGLNGSGLLLLNPPYQFDDGMRQWLPGLGSALGADAGGGTQLTWITHGQ
jgi:23S rRNA (adenine2030-N6)-methyltransferase